MLREAGARSTAELVAPSGISRFADESRRPEPPACLRALEEAPPGTRAALGGERGGNRAASVVGVGVSGLALGVVAVHIAWVLLQLAQRPRRAGTWSLSVQIRCGRSTATRSRKARIGRDTSGR